MIQRIQTVYLLLVVALGITLCFQPILTFDARTDEGVLREWSLSPVGLEETTDMSETPDVIYAPEHLNGVWGLFIATLIIPVLALVVIFLYKKRILQARLNIFLAMLCVGYYGIMGLFVWFAKMNLHVEGLNWHITPWLAIPLVCFVLTLMATRRILKDEALVRAADRLR
jgi:hypothetical protein